MIALIERTPDAKRAYIEGVTAGMELAARIADGFAINAQRRAADHRLRGVETALTAALDKMEAGNDIAARIREQAALHSTDGQSHDR
jgi:hypothetical protein